MPHCHIQQCNTSAPNPHENERSSASLSSPEAESRRRINLNLNHSSSYGSGRQSDAKPKQKQFRRYDSNIPERVSSSRSLPPKCPNASDRTRLEASTSSSSSRLPCLQQLPFKSRAKSEAETSTTSPRHRRKSYSYSGSTPLSPSSHSSTSRSSRQQQHVVHHVVRKSHLPRQNIFNINKGIDVKKHQLPPPTSRRMLMLQNTQTSDEAEAERSKEDAATCQLRKLCLDIIKSAQEGTSTPQRAEIKEVVVEYHRSRNNPISPRHPNFAEIPTEFSRLLTYGLARSQTVQRTTTEPSPARQSRLCGIKDEGQQTNESRLFTTVQVGPSDVESCVSLPSTIDDVFSI